MIWDDNDNVIILDDRAVNYPIYGEQCVRCKHFKLEPPPDGIGSACKAFARIPREILEGKHDHRFPFPGDNGIRFEPINEPNGNKREKK